jgi:hypothetical protein
MWVNTVVFTASNILRPQNATYTPASLSPLHCQWQVSFAQVSMHFLLRAAALLFDWNTTVNNRLAALSFA